MSELVERIRVRAWAMIEALDRTEGRADAYDARNTLIDIVKMLDESSGGQHTMCQHQNRCLWCGKDCSFISFCEALCVPCGDSMQSLEKTEIIKSLAKAVGEVARLERKLRTEPVQHKTSGAEQAGEETSAVSELCTPTVGGSGSVVDTSLTDRRPEESVLCGEVDHAWPDTPPCQLPRGHGPHQSSENERLFSWPCSTPNSSPAPKPWKGTSGDGSVGFDCEHGGRRVLVTLAADGDVEIVIPKQQNAQAGPDGSADLKPLLDRYAKCAWRIWDLFDRDPLGEHKAHFPIERLEALLDQGLIVPRLASPKRKP